MKWDASLTFQAIENNLVVKILRVAFWIPQFNLDIFPNLNAVRTEADPEVRPLRG